MMTCSGILKTGVLTLLCFLGWAVQGCHNSSGEDVGVTHTVTVSLSGTGSGEITSIPAGIFCPSKSCSAAFDSTEIVELIARPDDSSRFDSWNGECSGTAASCAFAANKDANVDVHFVKQAKLSIHLQGDADGLVRSLDETIQCGQQCVTIQDINTEVTLQATEGVRSLFAGFSAPCVADLSRCTVMLSEDLTLDATFHAAKGDILVIVNENSLDSPAVGNYYATQRAAWSPHIVAVRTPAAYFITWTEFKQLRDQIIAYMQANTLGPDAGDPVICTTTESPYYCAESVQQLRQYSTVRYLVTTRGVPTRMTVDGSPLSGAPTSVDNYLTSWLINYYEEDTVIKATHREEAFGDGRGMRTVRPKLDAELIVGRIDGLDLASSFALVDRAIFAEQNGVYGKLYGSEFRNNYAPRWLDHSLNPAPYIYGNSNTAWRYQLGLWGENQASCYDHLAFPPSSNEGKSPESCRVRLTDGVDAPPGQPSSRQPRAHDALVYLGMLDGQATTGSFTGFRNWRRDANCNITLCRDTLDPSLCRANSLDPFGEINSACMAVNPGFVGYNLQSYPVSYLTSWPTGWFQSGSNTAWSDLGGGDFNRLAFPTVRTDFGQDDNYSLFFKNSDQTINSQCFAAYNFDSPPTEPCLDSRSIVLAQVINLAAVDVDPVSPQTYTLSLQIMTESLDQPTPLTAHFFVHEAGAGNVVVDYGTTAVVTLPAGNSAWTRVEVTFTIDPLRHASCGPPCSYDGIKVRFNTARNFAGAIGFDAISLKEVGIDKELVVNGSFTEGHEQVSGGDHAANFLSRLGGTAFWGSLSHHGSGGYSFHHHVETLIYWLRGLPLGDAVWFDEGYNSGILYGDPLYTPVGVRIHKVGDLKDRVSGAFPIWVDTVNGLDATVVTTTYELDHCPGDDFFICDQENSWIPTGFSGVGGLRNQYLGDWKIPKSLAFAPHVLRLKVTSTHKISGRVQSFYDYYPFHNWTGCPLLPLAIDETHSVEDWLDSDGDGLGNPCDDDDDNDGVNDSEDPFPRNAAEWLDSDGDGIGNNSDEDDDNDGISDSYEIAHDLDPLVNDSGLDADNDGFINYIEYRRGTSSKDGSDVPAVKTIFVDGANLTGAEDGTPDHPFDTITEALLATLPGDTIEVATGTYDEPSGVIRLIGGITLNGNGSIVNSAIALDSTTDGSLCRYTRIHNIETKTLFLGAATDIRIEDVTIVGAASALTINESHRINFLRILVSASNIALRSINSTGVHIASSTLHGINYSAFVVSGTLAMHNVIIAGELNGIISSGNASITLDYSVLNPAPSDNTLNGRGLVIADPLFVDTVNGNFHLLSTSPAVDAGDPTSSYDLEPLPNGGRVNMGYYGNTIEAAKSPEGLPSLRVQ